MSKQQPKRTRIRPPLKAIRAFCLGCVETAADVRNCECEHECPTWHCRMGRNSRRKGVGRASNFRETSTE